MPEPDICNDVLLVSKHKKFLLHCMRLMPQEYEQFDTSRLTILFFCLSGLDVLGVIDDIPVTERNTIIEWIYSNQKTIKHEFQLFLRMYSPCVFNDTLPLLREVQRGEVVSGGLRSIHIQPSFHDDNRRVTLIPKSLHNPMKTAENSACQLIARKCVTESGLCYPMPDQTPSPIVNRFWTTDDLRYMMIYSSRFLNHFPPRNPLYFTNFGLYKKRQKNHFKSIIALLPTVPGPHKDPPYISNCLDLRMLDESSLQLAYYMPSLNDNTIKLVTYSCKSKRNSLRWTKLGESIEELTDIEGSISQVTMNQHSNDVILRTTSGLYSLNEQKVISLWFQGSTKHAEVSPHLENEMALVCEDDNLVLLLADRLIMLPRAANQSAQLNHVTWTDHPRCLYAVSDSELFVQDCRTQETVGNGCLTIHASDAASSKMERREQLVLCSTYSCDRKIISLLTSDQHKVFDIRRPAHPIIATSHMLPSPPNIFATSQKRSCSNIDFGCQFAGHRELCRIMMFPMQTAVFDSPHSSVLSYSTNPVLLAGPSKSADWLKVHYQGQHCLHDKAEKRTKCGLRGMAVTPFFSKSFGVSDKYFGFSISSPTLCSEVGQQYFCGHLAASYSALCCLLILGDDLSRIDKNSIIAGLKACQLQNGSFGPIAADCENDMRYVFCAAAISHILSDWSGFDKENAYAFITASMNYDGGIAQHPSLESHGGSTYCALASLHLMGDGYVDRALTKSRRKLLEKWCLMRQTHGFSGRPDKANDSCYTFWIGASQKMLDILYLVGKDELRSFTLSTQDRYLGGFAKYQDSLPDVLHTYLSLAGLSLLREPGLCAVEPTFNVTQRTSDRLKQIHLKQKTNANVC